MAVDVEPGKTYEANGTRNGGNWSLFKVKAEKGKDEIPVFTDGRTELHDGDQVTVKRITRVRKTRRKFTKDGKDVWEDSWSVNAEVDVNAGSTDFREYDDDSQLPF